MPRFWIAVASHEHVKKAIAGGFAQLCHGKAAPLRRLQAGDWLAYYSPTELFGEKAPYRWFTAIGTCKAGKPYQFAMGSDFTPWRRDIAYVTAQPAPIAPLIEQFSFVTNRKQWGLPFRRGFFEIPEADFQLIAQAMKANLDE